MKFSFAVSGRPGRILAGLAGLALVLMPRCNAGDLSWSNTLGTVTLYGSGSAATTLQTTAALGGDTAANSVNYLDASGSPVVSKSEVVTDTGSLTTLSTLGVDESQTTGLPFTSGSIGFSATGAGVGGGVGSGSIKLYLVISVPNPVVISLSEIRSVVMTLGAPSDAFSLALYQSDASGTKVGSALLSYSGNMFDQSGTYQTSSPYYVLEMSAAANATTAFSGSAQFSFALDLQSITPVPEPRTTSLLVLALLGVTVCLFRKGRTANTRG